MKKENILNYKINHGFADQLINILTMKHPWKKDTNEAVDICSTAINAFKIITIYLSPVIPNLTYNAFKFLNLKKDISFNDVESFVWSNK